MATFPMFGINTRVHTSGDEHGCKEMLGMANKALFQFRQVVGGLNVPIYAMEHKFSDGSWMRLTTEHGRENVYLYRPLTGGVKKKRTEQLIVPYLKCVPVGDVGEDGHLLWDDNPNEAYILLDWKLNPVSIKKKIKKCKFLDNKATLQTDTTTVVDDLTTSKMLDASVWDLIFTEWFNFTYDEGVHTETQTSTITVTVEKEDGADEVNSFVSVSIYKITQADTYTYGADYWEHHVSYEHETQYDNVLGLDDKSYFGSENIGASFFYRREEGYWDYLLGGTGFNKTAEPKFYFVDGEVPLPGTLSSASTRLVTLYVDGLPLWTAQTDDIAVGQIRGVKRGIPAPGIQPSVILGGYSTIELGETYNVFGELNLFALGKGNDLIQSTLKTDKAQNGNHIKYSINGLTVFEYTPLLPEEDIHIRNFEFGLCILPETEHDE